RRLRRAARHRPHGRAGAHRLAHAGDRGNIRSRDHGRGGTRAGRLDPRRAPGGATRRAPVERRGAGGLHDGGPGLPGRLRRAMDESERRRDGLAVRRRVLGRAHVARAQAATTPLSAEFQDLITRYAWGEVWTRPALDLRTRRILVIGTLIALRQWDEVAMPVRA